MSSMSDEPEKGFAPYFDNENDQPKGRVYLPRLMRMRRERPGWMTRTTIALTAIIFLLATARLVEGPIKAHWRKNHPASSGNFSKGNSGDRHITLKTPGEDILEAIPPVDTKGAFAEVSSHPGIKSPVQEVAPAPAVQSVAAVAPADAPVGLVYSTQDAKLGVSLAAAASPDGHIQLYELDDSGLVRMRKKEPTSYYYSDPQVVEWSGYPPKAGSPLSALTWAGAEDVLEHRLYYVTSSGFIGELASTCKISEPCKFTRTWAIPNKPSGGIAAIRTSGGGLLVYHVRGGNLVALASSNGKTNWFLSDPHIKAHENSSLAAHTRTVEGANADPVVLFVSPEGKLLEAGENRASKKWEITRTIDADFSKNAPEQQSLNSIAGTNSGPNNLGPPATAMRAYYLSSEAPMERFALPNTSYTEEWWPTTITDKPDVPGGAVAAVSWGDKEVRVIYGSHGTLQEVGLSSDPLKWWPRVTMKP